MTKIGDLSPGPSQSVSLPSSPACAGDDHVCGEEFWSTDEGFGLCSLLPISEADSSSPLVVVGSADTFVPDIEDESPTVDVSLSGLYTLEVAWLAVEEHDLRFPLESKRAIGRQF